MTIELVKEVKLSNDLRSTRQTFETWNRLLGYIEYIRNDLAKSDPDMLYDLIACMQATKNLMNNKPVFSASLETGIIPRLIRYMNNYTGIDVTEGKWTLESSQTGFLTIHDDKGMYLHSPSDPMWEAYVLARDVYDPDIKGYRILGVGLGYLPYQIWRLSEGAAEIFIYETDKELLNYADSYGVLSYIDEDNLHIIHKDDPEDVYYEFFESMKDVDYECKRYVYCSKYEDYDGEYNETISEFVLNESVTREFARKWDMNYARNENLPHKNIGEFDKELHSKEWVIVAAGPSVDENEDFIRESVGKRVICTVNTSIRWFFKKGLKPDICVACDPFDQMYEHIAGMQSVTEDVPLIADAVTNWRFMQEYLGDKYYVLSASSIANKDRNGENMKYEYMNFGGTVTDMAVCVAIRLGASKVYMVGADLAYPGGRNYSDNMSHKVESGINSGVTCVSVDGEDVQTSGTFNYFKNCIESHILANKEVRFENRSKHGAYIKGAFCGQWWEDNSSLKSAEDYSKYLEKLLGESKILGWKEKYYIFWQVMRKMIAEDVEMTENLRDMISENYRRIYEAFKQELDWTPTPGIANDPGQTFVFASAFYNGKDTMSRRTLRCAKKQTMAGRNTLIVNTAEYLGGSEMPLEDHEESQYDSELEKTEVVFYENKPYSYYQFPNCMPDLDFIREFLEFADVHRPGHMVKLNEYSLLADFCSEFIPTEPFE